MTSTRIHILGVGSIGTLLAHHLRLSKPSTPISLLVRSPRTFPGQLTSLRDGKKSVSSGYEVESSLKGEDKWFDEPIKNLLVATKTIQTLDSIKPLIESKRLDENSTITLLQNGMGVYQELIDKLFTNEKKRPSFILGTTPHAVSPYNNEKGQINHNVSLGDGFIKWGLVNDPYKNMNENFSIEQSIWGSRNNDILYKDDLIDLTIPKEREDLISLRDTIESIMSLDDLNPQLLKFEELNKALLLKLVVNSSVNTITAILGRGLMLNGKLLEIPEGLRLVDSIIKESSEILLKHLLKSIQTNSETEIKKVNLEMFEYENLKEMVYKVIKSTSTNITSMAVDIREKRKTEIDYINGYLVKLGNDLGCNTQTNQMICDMIKFIEKSHH
ncbi:uncharacterized protein L201_006168 [Kwoniella dendrophila CBS 6074]|uniref:2-dehydropantoate 2-reductase n=1 Tax=Kwoniella dendrophila CBS 6074 TaxID=1295534 RepID=A0AAX4K0G2_9TREE